MHPGKLFHLHSLTLRTELQVWIQELRGSNMKTTSGILAALCCLILAGFGLGCGSGGAGGGGGKNLNPPVQGLTAIAGNAQITLNWNAYPGATSYNVARSTTSGGECPAGCNYINTRNPTSATSYTDVGLINGTTYHYVVNANYSGGFSGLSKEASATPSGPSTSVAVTVDIFSNSHAMGLIYGGAFPKDTSIAIGNVLYNLLRHYVFIFHAADIELLSISM